MKITRSLPVLLTVALLGLSLPAPAADKAKTKADKLTLEDVIFDAKYLKQMLGPKTLLTFEKPTPEIPADLAKALQASGLADATKFMLLPPELGTPKLTDSIPYNYPLSVRRGRTEGRADFLVFLGPDGRVKTIHCYHQTDRMFALAVAAAVVRWQYEPVKIQGTAVPVLLALAMEFKGDQSDTHYYQRQLREPVANPPKPSPGSTTGGGS